MPVEITIVIKDDERTLRQKSLEYEPFSMTETDPLLKSHIDNAIQNFNGQPEDVIVQTKMTL